MRVRRVGVEPVSRERALTRTRSPSRRRGRSRRPARPAGRGRGARALVLGWAVRPLCLRLGYAEPDVPLLTIGAALLRGRDHRRHGVRHPADRAAQPLRPGPPPGRQPAGARQGVRAGRRPARSAATSATPLAQLGVGDPALDDPAVALLLAALGAARGDGGGPAARARVSRPAATRRSHLRCATWQPSLAAPLRRRQRSVRVTVAVVAALGGHGRRPGVPADPSRRCGSASPSVQRARPVLGAPCGSCGPRCCSPGARTPPTVQRPRPPTATCSACGPPSTPSSPRR